MLYYIVFFFFLFGSIVFVGFLISGFCVIVGEFFGVIFGVWLDFDLLVFMYIFSNCFMV